jgi:hypothetical protein
MMIVHGKGLFTMGAVGSGGVTCFSIRIDGHSLWDSATVVTQRTVALAFTIAFLADLPISVVAFGAMFGGQRHALLLGCVGSSWNTLVVLSRIVDTGKGVTKSTVIPTKPHALPSASSFAGH